MTKEEAIEFGNIWLQINEDCKDSNTYAFFHLAIEALEQKPSTDTVSREVFEQVMWERDVAITQLKELGYGLGEKPKTGHWITQWNPAHQKEYYYCPECREEYSYDGETGIKMNDYNYCPNCGCRMVEPQESEDKE